MCQMSASDAAAGARAAQEEFATSPPPKDLIKLKRLEEAVIVEGLRRRYAQDAIYTYVGTVLISVNPYRVLDDLYTPSTIDKYAKHPQEGVHDELDPHVFALAGNAYHGLVGSWEDQAVLISGESGAGKTEACKLVLEYLMEMSARTPKAGPGHDAGGHGIVGTHTLLDPGIGLDRLEDQCMQAQIIFESFGNAKTVRNDNSSRFGKWIEVLFSRSGHITGSSIRTYLLEKSRITHIDEGERNYHIFYQLLEHLTSEAAAGKDRSSVFRLEGCTADSFTYLRSNQGQSHGSGNGRSAKQGEQHFVDVDNFDKLINAFRLFGLADQAFDDIMRLLAAVLHLGNIRFSAKSMRDQNSNAQGSVVAPPPPGSKRNPLRDAAELLGVKSEDLEKAVCSTSVKAGKELIIKPNGVEKACRARDALAKGVYEGLFKWIGNYLNNTMQQEQQLAPTERSKLRTIGILDIFGFESLQTNSFEQICINYCNERLHYHFNEECFKIEQQEYISEGVSVENVPYIDNSECIQLFEASGRAASPGIFALIDTQVHTPEGNEEKLLETMYGTHKSHPNLAKPHPREGDYREHFKIVHYAGHVLYNSEGLLEKSRDAMHHDVKALLSNSSFELLRNATDAIAGPTANGKGKGGKGGGKASKATLGTQFCNQLGSLMGTINAAKPHFVKCIKPNDASAPQRFEVKNITEQLQYVGVLSLCQLRKVGYCERVVFDAFMSKYRCLCPKAGKTLDAFVKALSAQGLLEAGGWVTGHTKIMLKTEQSNALERALLKVKLRSALVLQRQTKAWLFRKRVKRASDAKAALRGAMASQSIDDLGAAIAGFEDRMPEVFHLMPLYRRAQSRLTQMKVEKEAELLLDAAIASREISTLEQALKTCSEMKYTKGKYDAAKRLMVELKQALCINMLQEAMEPLDKKALKQAIAMAKALGMSSNVWVKEAKKALKGKPPKAAPAKEEPGKEETSTKGKKEGKGEGKGEGDAAMSETDESKGVSEDLFMPAAGDENGDADGTIESMMIPDSYTDGDGEEEEGEGTLSTKAGNGALLFKEFGSVLDFGQPTSVRLHHLNGLANVIRAKINSDSSVLSEADVGVLDSSVEMVVRGPVPLTDLTPEEAKDFGGIKTLLAFAKEVLACNAKLKMAVYSKSVSDIIDALDMAENLGVQNTYVQQAVTMHETLLKNKEHLGELADKPTADRILDVARGNRWRFDKFVKLRPKQEYVRGRWMGRKRLMDTMLMHTREPIPNSLTKLPSDLNKVAIACFKCLLGCTGVKRTTFPASYAHELLKLGLRNDKVRDEVFLQQMKQIHMNHDQTSLYNSWLVLCVWITLFCPTVELELYVLNFLLRFADQEKERERERESGEQGQGQGHPYACYCIKVMQKRFSLEENVLKEKMRKMAIPSIDQIASILRGRSTPFLEGDGDEGRREAAADFTQ